MVYDPTTGTEIRDGNIDAFVYQLANWFAYDTEDTTRYYANELLFLAVRAAICEGRIDHTKVMFQYDGIDIPIDADGRLNDPPVGFCDNVRRYMRSLL
jgi:hypothetical protein